jgi:hypothetical protein
MAIISKPNDARGAPVNFINLPNGHVLAAAGSSNWVYTPIGAPKGAWRPTVPSITGSGTYHLSGTQLSGLVSVGEDDYQNPQNYPIVYLKDSAGHVYFARSFNFSSMITSRAGEAQTADFTVPSGLPRGACTLYVSACFKDGTSNPTTAEGADLIWAGAGEPDWAAGQRGAARRCPGVGQT